MAKSADPADRELETAIDALYQGPLDGFTAARNALAASLKKSGDKASAERVKTLAKPSSTAWAINQAWWQHHDRFQAMLDAGAAQRKAHVAWAQGHKADVRAAGEARRAAVGEVTDAAVDALGGRKAVTPDVQYRIAGTVEALASAGVPEGEVPGRLTRDLQSSGLDALTALAEAAGAAPRPTIVARGTPGESRQAPATSPATAGTAAAPVPAPSRKAPLSPAETSRERKAREAEETKGEARTAQLAQARSRLAELKAALAAATDASDRAAAEAEEARAELDARTKQRADLEAALDDERAAEAEARRALSHATAARSRAELDKARAARDAERASESVQRLESAK
jgi:hypothetical protein